MSKISFISSNDRFYNITRTLSLIKGEVLSGIRRSKKVVIKPNCVCPNNQLATTHKDALRAVLEFLYPLSKNQITIAEGSGIGETFEAFKNYRYFDLQEIYNFAFVDLNRDDFSTIKLLDRKGNEWDAQIAKTILDADYLVSLTPPKTHDNVIFTGAIKNVAVGSLLRPQGSFAARIASKFGIVRNNKAMIHQGYKIINENIARLAKKIKINLSVIDGYVSMQGDGPTNGEAFHSHWAVSSTDALSADKFACDMLGINKDDVGYLSILSESNNNLDPFIIGDPWKEKITKIKMHSTFEDQKKWK